MTTTNTTNPGDTPPPPPPQPFEVTVARKLASLSHSLLQTFFRLDVDRDGYVTRSDLKTALHNVLGLDLTREQMDAIFARFACFENPNDDQRRENGIRYQEFVKYMDATARQRLSIAVAEGPLLQANNAASAQDEMMSIVLSSEQERSQKRQALLKLLRAHASGSGGGMVTTSMFLQMDTHRSGKVSPQEFCDWVNHHIGKQLLTPPRFEELIGEEHYKKDGMDYEEFVAAMHDLETDDLQLGSKSMEDELFENEESPRAEEQAREHFHNAVDDCVDNAKSDAEIARVIAEKLFSKRVKLVDAFHKYDLDSNGKLNATELCQALNEVGLCVSVERAQSLVDKFDLDGDGRLNKGEFVRLVASSHDTAAEAATTTEGLRQSLVASVVGHEEEERHQEIANRLDENDIALLMSFRESLEAEKAMTRKLFQSMDKDGSKSLSAEELKQGFEQMGVDVSQEHIDHIMKRFETEGTGKLKYYQFVKLMSANLELEHSVDKKA